MADTGGLLDSNGCSTISDGVSNLQGRVARRWFGGRVCGKHPVHDGDAICDIDRLGDDHYSLACKNVPRQLSKFVPPHCMSSPAKKTVTGLVVLGRTTKCQWLGMTLSSVAAMPRVTHPDAA